MRISVAALVVAVIALIGVIWTGIQNQALVEDVEKQIRDVQEQVRWVEIQIETDDTINTINARITRLEKNMRCMVSPTCFLPFSHVEDY